MKKWFSLLVAGLLCLVNMAAFAEETVTIPTELLVMEDGLTFAVPAGWETGEITEEMQQQGVFVSAVDAEGGYTFIAAVEPVEGEATAADLADAMVEKADGIGAAQAMVNPQGQELIMFMTADGSNLGYCVLDGQGYMISFIFSRSDGQPISAETDAALIMLVSESAAAVHFEKPE